MNWIYHRCCCYGYNDDHYSGQKWPLMMLIVMMMNTLDQFWSIWKRSFWLIIGRHIFNVFKRIPLKKKHKIHKTHTHTESPPTTESRISNFQSNIAWLHESLTDNWRTDWLTRSFSFGQKKKITQNQINLSLTQSISI